MPGEPALIGTRIRQLRKARRMSAQKLSDATGGIISRCVISDVENNRRDDIPTSAAVAIAHVFNITVEALLDERISPEALTIAAEIAEAKARLQQALLRTA